METVSRRAILFLSEMLCGPICWPRKQMALQVSTYKMADVILPEFED